MTLTVEPNKLIIPTEDEIRLSQESSRFLAPLIRERTSTIRVKIAAQSRCREPKEVILNNRDLSQ